MQRLGSPETFAGASITAGEMFSNSYPFNRPEQNLAIEFTELTVPIFGHRYDSRTDGAEALMQLSPETKESLLENLLGAVSRFTAATEAIDSNRRRSRRATLQAALQTLDVAQQRRLTLSLQLNESQSDLGTQLRRLSNVDRSEQFCRPTTPRGVKMTHDLELTEDEDGDLLLSINHYSILDVLGRGSQGTVYLAFDETVKEFRAIKAIKKPMATSESMRQLQAEISIMVKLRHPNVVALHEVINPPQSKTLFLVMQYVEKGPIVEYMDDTHTTCKPHPPGPFVYKAKQLLSALQYLHKRKIYHQDIKPENIICGLNEQVYLSDFGVAQVFRDDPNTNSLTPNQASLRPLSPQDASQSAATTPVAHHSTRGTPAFFPPEKLSILEEDEAKPEIDLAAADVWALGVSFYFLLTGVMPFRTSDILNRERTAVPDLLTRESSQLAACVFATAVEFPDDLPDCWRRLLSQMLEKDPRRRLRLKEAMAALETVDQFSEGFDEDCGPTSAASTPLAKTSTLMVLEEIPSPEVSDAPPLLYESGSGAADSAARSLPIPSPPRSSPLANAFPGRQTRLATEDPSINTEARVPKRRRSKRRKFKSDFREPPVHEKSSDAFLPSIFPQRKAAKAKEGSRLILHGDE
jgi:serine/threonine protein kinase